EEDSGQILADHQLCLHSKGELIRNNNHGRDRSKGVQAYVDHVAEQFTDTGKARRYLEEIRKLKPRYIRDQLQAIEKSISKANAKTVDQALAYCLKHSLYCAADFADAASHFTEQAQRQSVEKPTQSDIKLLVQVDAAKLKAKPQIREFKTYERILGGG
ncbi:transposase, partial [Paenibacillus dendritiformis]|nr:transposase [Paenibacillus dendritiformis]MBG9794824.1 transposase [Paenibacillus dendritiformis]MBG9794827.1 transposase [Paenibacillus dendritiformis]